MTKLKQSNLRAVCTLLGLGLFLLPCMGAQDSLSDTEKVLPASFQNDSSRVTECVQALGTIYKGIDSMEYRTERNKPSDNNYERFLWREQASGKFYYEFKGIQKTPPAFDMERAGLFDGKRTYFFSPLDSYVTVKTGEGNLDVAAHQDGPLIPFRFLEKGDRIWKGDRVRLKDLQPGSPELLSLQKRALYLGEQSYKGVSCRVLRVTGAYDPILDETVDYDVYLDKARNLFPIGWREFDSDRIPVRSVFISQLNTLSGKTAGAVFMYPKQCIIWQSKVGKSATMTVDGKVVKYYPYETPVSIDNVSIDLDDTKFDFDPSTANTIYDEDSKMIMQVPK